LISGPKRAETTIYFLTAGVGWGNSVRCAAILNEVKENHDVRIIVFGWGRALEFWKGHILEKRIELRELAPLYSKCEGGSKFRKLSQRPFSLLGKIRNYILNSWKLFNCMGDDQPKLALLDSDYHYLPFLLRGVPTIALAQAPYVSWALFRHHLGTCRWGLLLRAILLESGERAVRSLFSLLTLVPNIDPSWTGSTREIPVGLILGPEVKIGEDQTIPESNKELSSSSAHQVVGFIRSGSGWYEKDPGSRWPSVKWLDLNAPYDEGSGSRFNCRRAKQVDAIACTGGLTSISEGLFFRKPVFILPFPDHPEHWINSQECLRLGIGETIENFWRDGIELAPTSVRPLPFKTTNYLPKEHFMGAEKVGKILLQHLRG
jgi:hypothetical protein